jgi:beta-phosphoglucomutase-like phosphatase (HAD superfamily)
MTSSTFRVDGHVLQQQHLAGKPAPDSFLRAAEMLRVSPQRSVVVEDAISGVAAGVERWFWACGRRRPNEQRIRVVKTRAHTWLSLTWLTC